MLRRIIFFDEAGKFNEFAIVAHIEFAHIFDLFDVVFFDEVDLGRATFAVDQRNDIEIGVRADAGHFLLIFYSKRVEVIVGVENTATVQSLVWAAAGSKMANRNRVVSVMILVTRFILGLPELIDLSGNA